MPLKKYDMGDYDLYPVNPNCMTVVPKRQRLQPEVINNAPAPPVVLPRESVAPSALNWERFFLGVLIGLGAIDLFKYLPAPTATAPTPVVDPVVLSQSPLAKTTRRATQECRGTYYQRVVRDRGSGRTRCGAGAVAGGVG